MLRLKDLKNFGINRNHIIIGLSIPALIGLVPLWSFLTAPSFNYSSLCTGNTNQAPGLTAQQLTDFLIVGERAQEQAIHNVLQNRLCSLPDLELRPGKVLKREVFALAFEKNVQLVVGFEGGEYVGYRFRPLKENAITVLDERPLKLYQNWTIKAGDRILGAQVLGSLGQITVRPNGGTVRAPFDGSVVPTSDDTCFRYDSIDIPGYAMLFCGLHDVADRSLINRGTQLGTSDTLLISLLRRQPEGTWAFVEPSASLLKEILK